MAPRFDVVTGLDMVE